MSDKDKMSKEEVAGLGCLGAYVIIQIGIPVMLFLLLGMALLKGCARMFR